MLVRQESLFFVARDFLFLYAVDVMRRLFHSVFIVTALAVGSLNANADVASPSPDTSNALYVSEAGGSNRNDGSKESPFKNIQKAVDAASDGATIFVAEGNYFGVLGKGNINVTKPVKIYGGYSPDFSTRDVLKHRTLVQPSHEANGTTEAVGGTVNINVKTAGTVVVLDGLLFDRGNSISYNAKGEGKPEGVESPMMNAVGTAGIGGADLKAEGVLTKDTAEIYLDNASCDVFVENCAFINAPCYGIRGMFGGAKAVINNNIFINNRMAAVEITSGGLAKDTKEVHFSNNTVLFMWSRLKDFGDMGYGYRYMTGINSYVTRNIIGLATFAGLERMRVDSDKAKEAERVTTAEHNIFFLNKQGDLLLPGGGMGMRVKAEDFEEVEQLAKVAGNKTLTDPAIFKGVINEAYLGGFLAASYKETTSVDANSPANTFRQALGMNMTGTMESSATMFANRYPWEEALKFFGAVEGCGAQKIKN